MTGPSTLHKVCNFVAFQAGWFVCVLGAAAGNGWIGPAYVALALVVHVLWMPRGAHELLAVLAAGAVGCVLDSVLAVSGVLGFSGPGPLLPWLPGWIVALWVLFASTLNCSLRWMRGHAVVAAVLGFVAGPLVYLGGVELEAPVALPAEAGIWFPAIGAAWAVATPLAMTVAARLEARATGAGGAEHVAGDVRVPDA